MLLYLSQLNFSFSNSSLLCIPDSPNLFRIFNWNYFKSLPCHLYRPSPPSLIVHSFSPQNITGGPVVWVSRIPLFPTGLTRPPPPAPQGLSSALCQSCGRGWTLCNWLPLVGWLVHPASLQSAASSVHFFFSMGWEVFYDNCTTLDYNGPWCLVRLSPIRVTSPACTLGRLNSA